MPDMEDITASGLAHAPGQEDRVFRITGQASDLAPDGVYVVKVKTLEDPNSPLGRLTLWMSASLCDSDGKALQLTSGPAVHPAVHQHVVDGHLDAGQGAPDVVGHIDIIQRQVAATVLNAIINRAAARTAVGVGQPKRVLQ